MIEGRGERERLEREGGEKHQEEIIKDLFLIQYRTKRC